MEARPHAKHPPYVGIWPKQLIIVLLLAFAVWKALLVALYYMHLRFEGSRLRIPAIAPLPLAVILVIAVITEYTW